MGRKPKFSFAANDWLLPTCYRPDGPHRTLDAAVGDVYGQQTDIFAEEGLERLLTLNVERSKATGAI